VGDSVPWMNDYTWIPHTFIKDQKRNLALNAATQMEKALRHPEMGDTIVYMYDDIVLLRDMTIADIGKPYTIGDYARQPRNEDGNWRKALWATLDVLRLEGKTLMNGETHLPRLIDKNTMLDILSRYDVGNRRFVAFTLYLNSLGLKKEQFIKLSKFDNIKAGFYGFEDDYGYNAASELLIEKVCENKLFLNYNDSGLSTGMKNFLLKKFSNKCRWEL
jgi:hypothetical protein